MSWLTPYSQRKYALESLLDASWKRLGISSDLQFDKETLDEIVEISQIMSIKNPLIRRGAEIDYIYVWGQDVSFKAEDSRVQDLIDAIQQKQQNRRELFSQQARQTKEKKLFVEGNIFFVLYIGVDGEIDVRSIPFKEIKEIITNPKDSREPWYYRRKYKRQEFNMSSGQIEEIEETRWYIDAEFKGEIPSIIAGDRVDQGRIYHSVGDTIDDCLFGLPATVAALAWALAYNGFLEDWATITRVLRMFSFKISGQTPQSLATGKAKTSSGITFTNPTENNPSPLLGSLAFAPQGQNIEPMKIANANISAEDGRFLFLMVCSALGYPETFFGSVSTGNLATAKTLDRPTELKIACRQRIWKETFLYIFNKAIDAKIAVGKLPKNVDRTIGVNFPDILEHDIDEMVKAIVTAATLNGFDPRTDILPRDALSQLLLTSLKVPNPEGELDKRESLFPRKEKGKEKMPSTSDPYQTNRKKDTT